MITKKIYNLSPIWFQNIIISLYGYKLYRERYGKIYKRTYKYLISKDYSKKEAELANQLIELKRFLEYSVTYSSFYKYLYSDIDIHKIETIEDLRILPIVDKEILRANINSVYTVSEKDGVTSFTGGTTGKSLKVLFTKSDIEKRMAYLDAFKFRVGIIDPFKAKKATFSGREFVIKSNKNIFWRHNHAYNQRLYSTFNLLEKNLPFYISNLNEFKPEIINGFVSAIYELSNYIKSNSIDLSFTPKAIFTTSETLLSFHRELIEDVFKCKIYNQYASAEGAPFITECLHGNLHYNLDTGVIETLLVDGRQQMIVTSFNTHGTPLIRYNIGDAIQFMDGDCKCGSSHPLVKSIEGRKVDYLYSKTIGKVSLSHLADVVKGVPNSIKKMQFIQNTVDEIVILIVVDEKLFNDETKNQILKQMEYRFGVTTKFQIKTVNNIPREKSGKYSLIKNNLKL